MEGERRTCQGMILVEDFGIWAASKKGVKSGHEPNEFKKY